MADTETRQTFLQTIIRHGIAPDDIYLADAIALLDSIQNPGD